MLEDVDYFYRKYNYVLLCCSGLHHVSSAMRKSKKISWCWKWPGRDFPSFRLLMHSPRAWLHLFNHSEVLMIPQFISWLLLPTPLWIERLEGDAGVHRKRSETAWRRCRGDPAMGLQQQFNTRVCVNKCVYVCTLHSLLQLKDMSRPNENTYIRVRVKQLSNSETCVESY